MKKTILIIATLLITSCAGLPGKTIIAVYAPISEEATIFLREIKIEPQTSLSGIAGELPALLRSLLTAEGFTAADSKDETDIELELFIHKKNYTHNFSSFESVTLTMKFFRKNDITAYLMYSEDTDRSLDSFGWAFSLIKHNITAMAAELHEK